MRHYQITFIGVGILAALSVAAFLVSFLFNGQQKLRFKQVQVEVQQALVEKNRAESNQRAEDERIRPLRSFLKLWQQHLKPAAPKELGLYVRSALTSSADMLSLAYDGVTVPPDPASFTAGNYPMRAQKNTITVTSESLPTLLTWLGTIEQKLPYSRVELASLSAYGSRSVQLAVTLYYPFEEDSPRSISTAQAYP